MKKVLGVVGPIASGKGRLIEILQKKGFIKFSLSDEIKQELKSMYPSLSPTRKDYQDLGDKLRKKYGNDYLAKKVGKKIQLSEPKKVVIDSIRNPAEVVWFKKNLNMTVIAIDAPKENRLKWMIKRKRNIDSINTMEEIETAFKRDLGLDQPEFGQQVKECMGLADINVNNNGTLHDLDKKIQELVKRQKIT